MVELNETFDPASIPEDDRNFDPIPAGTYKLQVIESKIEDTKNSTGQMLTLTLEVVDGPMANRRIWDRLNIVNQNPDAQRIAQRSLADLALALNIMQLRNTDELHFKPFMARVTIQPDKSGQYGPQNRVRYTVSNKPPAGKQAVGQAGKPAGASQGQQAPKRPWGSGGVAKPAAQGATKAEMDEEIPF